MKKISLLLGVIYFVAGCGSKQNPMDGKPNSVIDVRPPVEKTQMPAPKNSDAVRIEFSVKDPDGVKFNEGQEGRFGVSAFILEENYEATFEIVNEADFPGIRADQKTGEIVWTPPKGYIFGGTQSEDVLRKDVTLTVRAFGRHKYNGDAVIYTRESSIRVVVEKIKGAPIMVVTGLTDDSGSTKFFQEGTSYDFKVVVTDEDAGPRMETQPRLDIVNLDGQAVSLAPFIKTNNFKVNYKTREYTYEMTLNLGKSNITEGYSAAGFGLRATSRFNVATPVFRVESGIVAKFGDINTTWTEIVKMPRGTTVTIPFLLFESTARATLKATAVGNPEGSSISCNEYSQTGIVSCAFTWEVPPDEAESTGDFDLEVVASSGTSSTQVNNVEKRFRMQFEIVKPVRPRPDPTPAPEQRKRKP